MRHATFGTLLTRLPGQKTAVRSFRRLPSKSKYCQPKAQSLPWAGGLWLNRSDKSQINLAPAGTSRYFSNQFFASLKKWVGARNPVRIGSSCAAVTGYDFPIGPIP